MLKNPQKHAALARGIRFYCDFGFEKIMISKRPAIRFTAYVLLISLLSLVLQAVAQVIGQFLIYPVILPLLLLSVFFQNLGDIVGYLDVDSGPFAAFLFRGLVTGLFWGGCIAFPFDMYRRTKQKKYKIIIILLGVYALLVFLIATAFILILVNSGMQN